MVKDKFDSDEEYEIWFDKKRQQQVIEGYYLNEEKEVIQDEFIWSY